VNTKTRTTAVAEKEPILPHCLE